MEILTGFIIAGFIYYSGYMVSKGQIEIYNFFSFLAAMMLAYHPIRSLASINRFENINPQIYFAEQRSKNSDEIKKLV